MKFNVRRSATLSLFTLLWLVLSGGLFVQGVDARSFTYPEYDVDIKVYPDSVVDVTETLTYSFDGEYQGVIRQIKLQDEVQQQNCIDYGLTCGGFERIAILGVYDEEGKLVDPSNYEQLEETNEDSGQSFRTIKWTVWPGGKLHDPEDTFTWTIKYRLYGSIGYIQDKPHFYWNALPESRQAEVDNARISVEFPENVTVNVQNVEVYSNVNDYIVDSNQNFLIIEAAGLPSYGDFTVAYPMPNGSVKDPAAFTYFSWLPMFGVGVTIDGIDLGDIGGGMQNFPSGEHEIAFSFPGYETATFEVDAKPGSEIHQDFNLQPTWWMSLLLLTDLGANILGLILTPLAVAYVYWKWYRNGRDQSPAKTIIPLFHPPKDVHPYLLGSLKDESVDKVDITGTIIDLAYRGYIKIKELNEGQNYELIRLQGKEGDPGLNQVETELLDGLFSSGDTVETKKLGAKFYTKFPKLQSLIYQQMVDNGYFVESPQATRNKYIAGGIGCFILGCSLLVFGTIGGMFLIGVPGPLFLGLAVLVFGITMAAAGSAMPAKTALGSKVLGEVLGFRMYLHTAERYRLQNLGPEEFERYLSYAIVFGIEKEWAEKFKDIYEGQPDWYEGEQAVWDAYWVSNLTRSFADSMNSSVYSAPASNSSSGSGWSGGGGSFGGFSGGGGGGGGSGAF